VNHEDFRSCSRPSPTIPEAKPAQALDAPAAAFRLKTPLQSLHLPFLLLYQALNSLRNTLPTLLLGNSLRNSYKHGTL
jgi:hypothetical protein